METSDHALMAEVQRGDERAFEALVSRHGPGISRYLRAIVRDPERALDLTQETFLKVWLHAGRFEPTGAFKAWLYRVARNVALSDIRKARVREFLNFEAEPYTLDPPCDRRNPEQAAHDAEIRSLLLAELGELPVKLREAFVLGEIEDLSIAEVAAIMSSPEGTIKARLHRARHALRKRLEARFGGAASKVSLSARILDLSRARHAEGL